MEIIPEKFRLIFFGLAVVLTINGLFMTIYSHLKPNIKEEHKYFAKGMLFLGIALLFSKLPLVITVHSPFNTIISISSVISLIYGLYLCRKGNKLSKPILREPKKLTEISKPAGIIFGIFCLLFAPISGFFAIVVIIGSIFDETIASQQEWDLMIFGVLAGIICVFLAVVGWRLINEE